jgi:hypothetical protein
MSIFERRATARLAAGKKPRQKPGFVSNSTQPLAAFSSLRDV